MLCCVFIFFVFFFFIFFFVVFVGSQNLFWLPFILFYSGSYMLHAWIVINNGMVHRIFRFSALKKKKHKIPYSRHQNRTKDWTYGGIWMYHDVMMRKFNHIDVIRENKNTTKTQFQFNFVTYLVWFNLSNLPLALQNVFKRRRKWLFFRLHMLHSLHDFSFSGNKKKTSHLNRN